MDNNLDWYIKYYHQLNVNDLYDILHLRSEVFVVEQQCVYQDIDNKDQKALHVLGYADGSLAAYCRLFRPGDYFEQASIGRVVVSPRRRKHGFGHLLMKKAVEIMACELGETKITISAQLYLQSFYESHGFVKTGDGYLEDGIPHIQMRRG